MSYTAKPRVWSRFVSEKDGKQIKLRIEDFSDLYMDRVIDLNINYFVKEETFLKSIGLYKSEEAVKEARQMVINLLKSSPHSCVVCCIDDDDATGIPDIVAISLMEPNPKLSAKTAEMDNFYNSTEVRRSFEIFHVLENLFDVLQEYNLNLLYEDRGLVVHPDYRGLGICTQLFKVRQMMCKEHKVPLTGAWITTRGSQIAAKKAGWKTVYEINYTKLGHLCGVTFDDVPENCVYMIATA